MDAEQACRTAVARHLPSDAVDRRAIVACSGGPDSVALVRAAGRVARATGWAVEAVIVDHGLQVGSDTVAERARALCAQLDVPAQVVQVEVPAGPGGMEAAARAARYAALRSRARAMGADRILLGHTKEDQAETVLMRLARGSGARSLSGMAAVNGDLHRPFLGLARATVRATVSDLTTWADPHNSDPRFLRARVRAEVLPVLIDVLGEAAVDGLARTAGLMRDDADALDGWAAEVLDRSRLQDGTGMSAGVAVHLDVAALEAVPRAVRTRVLRRAAVITGAPPGALTREHIDAVEELVSRWRGQGPLALPGAVTAGRRYGRLYLEMSGTIEEGGPDAP